MCNDFSCVAQYKDTQVYWRLGLSSHEKIITEFNLRDDLIVDGTMAGESNLCRFEVIPAWPKNYLSAGENDWILKVDECHRRRWVSGRVLERVWKAHGEWVKQMHEAIKNVAWDALSVIDEFHSAPAYLGVTSQQIALFCAGARAAKARALDRNVWVDLVGRSVANDLFTRVTTPLRSLAEEVLNAGALGSNYNSLRWEVRERLTYCLMAYKVAPDFPGAAWVELMKNGLIPVECAWDTWRLLNREGRVLYTEVILQ